MDEFIADPCPACKPDTVCRTPSCGRLKGKRQEPVIQNKQSEPVGVTIAPMMYKFLMGEGSIDGCWFGDRHSTLKGAFWWRSMLRHSAEAHTHPAPAVEQEPVAVVPDHCTGAVFVFEGGVLNINKDGSGNIVVQENDFQYLDERCAWVAKFEASEILALRDFLNGKSAPAVAVNWLPMDMAPKDGTLCRLLVEFEENGLEDSDSPTATIGFNTLEDNGEDFWHLAGWNWCHDEFTQGSGKVIGWLPLIDRAVAVNEQLLEAVKLADAMLSGANMNANVVHRKVKDAIKQAEAAKLRRLVGPESMFVAMDEARRLAVEATKGVSNATN